MVVWAKASMHERCEYILPCDPPAARTRLLYFYACNVRQHEKQLMGKIKDIAAKKKAAHIVS